MVNCRFIEPESEICGYLTQGCDFHPPKTHQSLKTLFRGLGSDAAWEIAARCRAMTEIERFVAEKTILTRALMINPPQEAARIIVQVTPLAIEIIRNTYCPEVTAEEALHQQSLNTSCVFAIQNFVGALDLRALIWKDTNTVRGRYLLATCGGRTGQSEDELKWLGENSMELAKHIIQLQNCAHIDRKFCESLMSTTIPLLDGIL